MNKFLLPEISKMHGIDSFCFQNCLRIVLEIQGVLNPELYLNATLSLRYDTINGEIKADSKVYSLLPSEVQNVKRIKYDEIRDPREVLNENLNYVQEKDSPIMVGVDTYFLPYASNYKKHHARHTILLCGWDELTQCVEVIDWYPDWFFKGKVSLEDFLAARSSQNESDGTIYSGKKIGNVWAVIEGVEQRSKESLLMEFLKTMREEYYREADERYLYGPQAVAALADIVGRCVEKEDFDTLHRELWFIGKRYRFFEGYLRSIGGDILEDKIEKVREVLSNEAQEWERLLLLSAKGCVSPSERIRTKMILRIDSVLILEEKLEGCLKELEQEMVHVYCK